MRRGLVSFTVDGEVIHFSCEAGSGTMPKRLEMYVSSEDTEEKISKDFAEFARIMTHYLKTGEEL
jgi:hypothetical protein